MHYWYPYAQLSQGNQEPGRQGGRLFSEELLSSNLGKVITVYLTYEKIHNGMPKSLQAPCGKRVGTLFCYGIKKRERISCYLTLILILSYLKSGKKYIFEMEGLEIRGGRSYRPFLF